MKKRKHSDLAYSMPTGIALGALLSLAITIALSAGLTHLVIQGIWEEEKIGYGIIAILILSAFSGSMSAANKIKHRRLLVCLGTCLSYWAMLLCITAMFFDGSFSAVGETGVIILAAGFAAVFCCKNLGQVKSIRRFSKISQTSSAK